MFRVTANWLAAFAVLLIVIGVYSPGLSGGFLLDDEANLGPLSTVSLADWQSVWRFVVRDISGPMGRMVSLLSFALQAPAWPIPFSFKLVNVLIHAANCLLVAWVASKLVPVETPFARWLPWGVALLWGLLPIQVAGVLYVVQRMNLLAAFFSLLALGAYLTTRQATERRWWGWGATSLALVLACLSKESALVLPLYIVVLEATLLPRMALSLPPFTRLERRVFWSGLASGLGLGLIFWGYWNQLFHSLSYTYSERGYGLSEQLASEARVLITYLRQILLPRPAGLGVIHDDFEVSQDWLAPMSGSLCALLILAVVVVALGLRRKWVWFSFGVLWFFAGHLLESSLLPLELYFDHRNYLPSVGLVVGLGGGFVSLLSASALPPPQRGRLALIVVLLPGLYWGLSSLAETSLWGNPLRQAEVMAQEHPRSVRALENLGNLRAAHRDYSGAQTAFESLQDLPGAGGVGELKLLQLKCAIVDVPLPSPDSLRARFAALRPMPGTINALFTLLSPGVFCERIRPQVQAVIGGLQGNPQLWPRLRYRLGLFFDPASPLYDLLLYKP